MPTKKPPAPTPPSRDEWCADFSTALRELRPGMGQKLASKIAIYQYNEHQAIDPAIAAKRWAAGQKQ